MFIDQAEALLQELRQRTYDVVGKTPDVVGVAFSGGLDSSILAKICKDLDKNVRLLAIGFPGSSDIEHAAKVAKEMGLPIVIRNLKPDNLENDLKTVISVTRPPSMLELEIYCALFYAFQASSEQRITTILTANGLDELFCGYDMYKRILEDEKEKGVEDKIMSEVKRARENERKYAEMAKELGINEISPFLDSDFVDVALRIPLKFKIQSTQDDVRKHILRELATQIGVPSIAANRPKKSIQYSTRIDKEIERMARSRKLSRNGYFSFLLE